MIDRLIQRLTIPSVSHLDIITIVFNTCFIDFMSDPIEEMSSIMITSPYEYWLQSVQSGSLTDRCVQIII
jgi:hypothetical protein